MDDREQRMLDSIYKTLKGGNMRNVNVEGELLPGNPLQGEGTGGGDLEAEFSVMRSCWYALSSLPREARYRVVQWLGAKECEISTRDEVAGMPGYGGE